jgi:hypothetical protein
VASALVGVAPQAAHAACATPVDQVTAMQRADSVFVGRVTELSDLNRTATMAVVETWKGADLGSEVTVNGSLSGSPVVGPGDRTYLPGSTYLVVPFGSRSPFFDDACSGTGLYVPSGGQIPPQFHDAVGTMVARVPATVAPTAAGSGNSGNAGGMGRFMIGGAALMMLVLYVLIRRRGKRRRISGGAPAPAASHGPPSPVVSESRAQTVEARVGAAAAVSAVAGRKKRRRAHPISRVRTGETERSSRLHKSGLSSLEASRKRTRRIKAKRAAKG